MQEIHKAIPATELHPLVSGSGYIADLTLDQLLHFCPNTYRLHSEALKNVFREKGSVLALGAGEGYTDVWAALEFAYRGDTSLSRDDFFPVACFDKAPEPAKFTENRKRFPGIRVEYRGGIDIGELPSLQNSIDDVRPVEHVSCLGVLDYFSVEQAGKLLEFLAYDLKPRSLFLRTCFVTGPWDHQWVDPSSNFFQEFIRSVNLVRDGMVRPVAREGIKKMLYKPLKYLTDRERAKRNLLPSYEGIYINPDSLIGIFLGAGYGDYQSDFIYYNPRDSNGQHEIFSGGPTAEAERNPSSIVRSGYIFVRR